MENASKALIMAATILLGVLILAFMAYMFNDAARLNLSHENSEKEKSIQKFNADFLTYESEDTEIIVEKDGRLIISLEESAEDTQIPPRFIASTRLNKISEVISAVNDAHNINYINNREYKNSFIEYTNAMVIVIDLNSKNNNITKEFLGNDKKLINKFIIFPHSDIEVGYLYGMTDSEFNTFMTKIENHEKNIDISSLYKVECSKFMEFFRESRIANPTIDDVPDNRNYTLYKYYFSGKLNTNEITGKVDRITFTVVEDTKY